jgi:hypothetical protein
MSHDGFKKAAMTRFAMMCVIVLATAPADARRIGLSCRQGFPASERVYGLQTGGRTYPFCQSNLVVNSGRCVFHFCPSMDYVIGCNLNLRCLGPASACDPASPDQPRDEVMLAAGHQMKALLEDGSRVVFRCRPGVRLQTPSGPPPRPVTR